MALPPIDFGPPAQADQSGIAVAKEAVAQRERVFGEVKQLGENVQQGGLVIAQGLLHNQALSATAAVKERQASTLSFIESNPYVSKDALRGRMSKEDFEGWNAALDTEYQKSDTVPMFTVAGKLFDSEARQAREQASQLISLPGWRKEWDSTERTESSTIRERYVNRIAADQMVNDQRARWLTNVDRLIAAGAFNEAVTAARTSPWAHPGEKEAIARKALAAKDAFPVEEAIRTNDVDAMGKQLERLQGKDAAAQFPNLDEAHRVDLEQRLERVYGFHAALKQADALVSAHVDKATGKVDSTAIENDLINYKGANKEEVVKAGKLQESEYLNLQDKRASDWQDQLGKAGTDPATGEFSYARMMKTPGMSELAEKLNDVDFKKLSALRALDDRAVRSSLALDAAEEKRIKAENVRQSSKNIRDVHAYLDDERNAADFAKMTPSQWNSFMLDLGHFEKNDYDEGLRAFQQFQNRIQKPSATKETVASEIVNAAGHNKTLAGRLETQFGDALRQAANAYARQHVGETPDKLDAGLREKLRAELAKGSVVGGGTVFGDANGVRRIEYENTPAYRGKSFKDATTGRTSLTIDGETKFWDEENKQWVDK